jgi:hypothetical protein
MEELLSEMKQCRTVGDCIELATVDANGEEEQAVGWLTCIEEMFSRFKCVSILGHEVDLDGFDLANGRTVVAICRSGKKKAKIGMESVVFPTLSTKEALWFKAWKKWSHA